MRFDKTEKVEIEKICLRTYLIRFLYGWLRDKYQTFQNTNHGPLGDIIKRVKRERTVTNKLKCKNQKELKNRVEQYKIEQNKVKWNKIEKYEIKEIQSNHVKSNEAYKTKSREGRTHLIQ